MRASLSHMFPRGGVPEQPHAGMRATHALCKQEGGMLDARFKPRGRGELSHHSSRIYNTSVRRFGALYTIQVYIHLAGWLAGCLIVCLNLYLFIYFFAHAFIPKDFVFNYTQMFRPIYTTALSCVYNKEVLVWRSEGSEVEEWVLLKRGWGHSAVGVNTGWCQFSLWPQTTQCNMLVFSLIFPTTVTLVFSRGTATFACWLKEPAGGLETNLEEMLYTFCQS